MRLDFPWSGRIRRWSRRFRGSATVVSLLLLMVFVVLGMVMAATSLQAVVLTRTQQRSSVAFNLAEAGAERGLRYLRVQASPPAGSAAFSPFGATPIALGSGTYSVEIDPDDDNASASLKRYAIRSTGSALGRQETVELYVRMSTFGSYAFFFDNWPSGTFLDNNSVVDGPAHVNGSNGVPMLLRWSNSAANPIFRRGLFTTALSSISYLSPSTAPTTEAEYQKIFELGSAGYRLGVSTISLPPSTSAQQIAAWGSSSGFPATDGVYVPAAASTCSSGIYMQGSFDRMLFRVTAATTQVIELTQGSRNWEITIDRVANTTQIVDTEGSNPPVTTSLTGTPNGSIYCSGDIADLSGQLADSYVTGGTVVSRNASTLCNDTAAGRSITVTGDIRYRTPPNNGEDWDSNTNLTAATLGLVSDEVRIAATAPTNFRVDATMVCGRSGGSGKFWAPAYATRTPAGTVQVFGGIVANEAGVTSTTQPSGWYDSYYYDLRLRSNPPPYFPTTGLYQRLSFRRISAGVG